MAEVDHVPHVDLVVGLGDDEVVLNFLNERLAHLAPNLPLLLNVYPVLLWDYAVGHKFREPVMSVASRMGDNINGVKNDLTR